MSLGPVARWGPVGPGVVRRCAVRLANLLAGLLAGLLVLAACTTSVPPASVKTAASTTTVPDTRTIGPAAATPGAGAPGPGASGGTGSSAKELGATGSGADLAPVQWAAARAAASQALVTERIAAQARGDRPAWLAPVSGTALRDAQGAVFDRMVAIQVRDLRLVALTEVRPPIPSARGKPVTWDLRAALDYDIAGFQTAPRHFTLDLSLRAAPGTPGAAVIIDSKPGDRPQPWDIADLEVRRSADSLVLGVGASATLDELVRRADAAHDRVAAVWGSAAPAVVVLPATDDDAARLLGDVPGGLAGVVAVTDGPLSAGRVAGADRIVIVPGPWTSLTATGRDVVLTHELTHVAVRATTTRAVPLWLSEGFAEYVAYRSVRLSEAKIVAPLLTNVRTSAPPAHLPGPEAFDPANGTLSAAYGMALLAVRTLADARGTAALVRFYRAAAGGLAVPTTHLADHERVVDDALATTLGIMRPGLERDWRARIAALARS